MNSDILTGKWNQMKGDAKITFGKLTADDMLVIDGDMTKAAGLVQERYGISKEEAGKRWNTFTARYSDVAAKAPDHVHPTVESGKTRK